MDLCCNIWTIINNNTDQQRLNSFLQSRWVPVYGGSFLCLFFSLVPGSLVVGGHRLLGGNSDSGSGDGRRADNARKVGRINLKLATTSDRGNLGNISKSRTLLFLLLFLLLLLLPLSTLLLATLLALFPGSLLVLLNDATLRIIQDLLSISILELLSDHVRDSLETFLIRRKNSESSFRKPIAEVLTRLIIGDRGNTTDFLLDCGQAFQKRTKTATVASRNGDHKTVTTHTRLDLVRNRKRFGDLLLSSRHE